jgi:hypothetical protein
MRFELPADFVPDLEYLRDHMLWCNECVIQCLSEDRVARAEAWLAMLESIRQHLDLYCRSLEK